MSIDSAKFRTSLMRRYVAMAALLLAFALFGQAGSFAAAPDAPASAPVLKIEGAVATPLSLTADDLDKMPRTTATLTADGNTTTYEGVLLYDVLVKAGWQFGRGMTGKGMASYLIATAKDGYQVVFALPELDPCSRAPKSSSRIRPTAARCPDRSSHFA